MSKHGVPSCEGCGAGISGRRRNAHEPQVGCLAIAAAAPILETADAMLSPSTFESFPSAIKEAMAAGVLVIATPVGGIPELIIDGETGILCKGTSVDALVEGIQRAVSLTREDYHRIVEAARRVARVEFHPNRAANDLMEMYLRALEIHSSGASLLRENAIATAPATDRAYVSLVSPSAVSQSENVEQVGNPPLGYEPLVGTLRYRLNPRRLHLKEIRVFVCTPQQEARGRLAFRIRSENEVTIREGEVPFEVRNEARWVTLQFPVIAPADGQSFILELSLQGPRRTKVGLFEVQHRRSRLRRAARLVGISPIQDNLFLQLVYA